VAGEQRGELFIETSTKVTIDELEAAYRATYDELKAFQPDVKGKRDVIEEIAAVPQPQLCNPSIVRAVTDKPCVASDTFTLAFRGDKRQLLISDDRSALATNMRTGLATAVCEFQPAFDLAESIDKICEMTKAFAGAH
jgi:hypothetical protein